MKNNITIQEILLMTATSFSHRQLCEINPMDKKNNYNSAEQLEAACWNGLLPEMLPEVVGAAPEQRLYLWQVDLRSSYLRLSLSNRPPYLERYFSLDPYIFLQAKKMN